MTIVVTPPHARRLTKPRLRSFSLPMNLAVGLRSDQQPERQNDHVRVYEEKFAPPTSASRCPPLSLVSPKAHSTAPGRAWVGSEQRTRRVKLKFKRRRGEQIPAPAREGARAEVSSLEASHAESTESVL